MKLISRTPDHACIIITGLLYWYGGGPEEPAPDRDVLVPARPTVTQCNDI